MCRRHQSSLDNLRSALTGKFDFQDFSCLWHTLEIMKPVCLPIPWHILFHQPSHFSKASDWRYVQVAHAVPVENTLSSALHIQTRYMHDIVGQAWVRTWTQYYIVHNVHLCTNVCHVSMSNQSSEQWVIPPTFLASLTSQQPSKTPRNSFDALIWRATCRIVAQAAWFQFDLKWGCLTREPALIDSMHNAEMLAVRKHSITSWLCRCGL